MDPLAGLVNLQPGYSLPLAEDDLQQQILAYRSYVEQEDWGKAFRLLTELDGSALEGMVPVGDDGLHIGVSQQVQSSLLGLGPEGLRAFRLYFDGQAREQFDEVLSHPMPGSEAQLELTESLVSRMLASSIGGEAAELLGDLYFGRGLFRKAQRYWALALEYGEVSGQRSFALQTKLVMAIDRGGDRAAAASLYTGLKARYSDTTIKLGGEEIDAIALLGERLEGAADVADVKSEEAPALELPKKGALPAWSQKFLSQANTEAMTASNGRNNYYRGPQDLNNYVPQVVADQDRVYFHWLGKISALDRDSGKILWRVGRVEEAARIAGSLANSSGGDPRNYRISLAGDVLLVTASRLNKRRNQFTLSAYNTQTGQLLWNTEPNDDWYLPPISQGAGGVSLRGDVIAHEGWAYAIYQPVDGSDCFLRKFDLLTGSPEWTLPIGTADPLTFQYTEIKRMPQPLMVLGDDLLYVMMNNGSLIAVDTATAQMKWAMRTEAPFGIGQTQQSRHSHNNRLWQQLESFDNPNGSGTLLLQDDVLYAKEHNTKTLYALAPATGELRWSRDKLDADAKLIGIDREHFYMMNKAVKGYHLDGERALDWHNKIDTGSPKHAASLMSQGKIMVLANDRLNLLDTTKRGDRVATYANSDYLGNNGGRLYRFDDLLICINTKRLTAYRLGLADDN